MRVHCDIDEIDLDGDYGTIESVMATCSRCDHSTEAFGTSDASIRRCLVVMREECPWGEANFYVEDEGGF